MKYLFKLNQYNQQRQREYARWIYPIRLAMYAQYLRNQGHTVYWDDDTEGCNKIITSENQIRVPFADLPAPDRIFTEAMSYKYQNNGNFKYLPGTYIQSADGCAWGRCTFCVENGRGYQIRKVEDVIEEIKVCKQQGFKEVFDDSGTFPDGEWRKEFCKQAKGIDIKLGCNLRVEDTDFKMLREAGFRMVLFGVESASQETLDRINKGVKVEQIEGIIKKASQAGLSPHVCVIIGYPWETKKDANNTLKFVRKLLSKGFAKTAQASVYDIIGHHADDSYHRITRRIFKVAFNPRFWYHQIKDIKTKEDFKYLLRGIKKGIE